MLWQQWGLGRVGDGALTPPTNIPLPRTAGRAGGQRCCSLPPPPPPCHQHLGGLSPVSAPFSSTKSSWTHVPAAGRTPTPAQRERWGGSPPSHISVDFARLKLTVKPHAETPLEGMD